MSTRLFPCRPALVLAGAVLASVMVLAQGAADGQPAILNGLYSTCINGDYYRRHALTILSEALDRYDVDGESSWLETSGVFAPSLSASTCP